MAENTAAFSVKHSTENVSVKLEPKDEVMDSDDASASSSNSIGGHLVSGNVNNGHYNRVDSIENGTKDSDFLENWNKHEVKQEPPDDKDNDDHDKLTYNNGDSGEEDSKDVIKTRSSAKDDAEDSQASHSETTCESGESSECGDDDSLVSGFAGMAQLQMMQMMAAGMLAGHPMLSSQPDQPSTSNLAAWQALAQQALMANLQLARRFPAMTEDDDEDSQNDVDCMKRYYEKLTSTENNDEDETGSSESDTAAEEDEDDNEDLDYIPGEKKGGFLCNERKDARKKCAMVFESKDMLMYHKTSAHGTPCNVCGIKVFPVSEMSVHMKEAHPWLSGTSPAVPEKPLLSDSSNAVDSNKSPQGKNFPCTICGVSFGSRSTMTAHKSSAHGSPCMLCGKKFLSDRYLGAHMKDVHNEELHKLPDGMKIPPSVKPPPIEHTDTTSDSQDDPDSSKSSINMTDISLTPQKHGGTSKRVEKDIPTKLAQITTLQNEALKLPANAHLVGKFNPAGPGRFHQDEDGNPECQLCLKKFSSFKALKIHMKDIHIGARNFSCEKCDQTFKRKGDLKSHMNKHLQPRAYKCYLCHETFNWQGNLTTHFRRKHSQEKAYNCPVCDKGFACSSGLKEHLNTHTDARPHNCDLCGKTFKSKSAQRRHMLKLHKIGTEASLSKLKNTSPSKMHECPHCDKKFRFISELHIHMGTKEPHICKVCQKECLCKNDYKAHMQNSHREKPLKEAEYTCDICKRKFLKRYNWQQHMAKLHSSRQFNCNQCEAVFDTEHDYNLHRQNDHMIQVFPCVECGSEFRNVDKLEQHMKTEHQISVEVKEDQQLMILKDIDGDSEEDADSSEDSDTSDNNMADNSNSVDFSMNAFTSESNTGDIRSTPAFTNGNHTTDINNMLMRVVKAATTRPKLKERVISLQNKLECPVCQKTFRYNGYHFRRHLRRHKEEKQKITMQKKKTYLTCEHCGKVLTTKMHYTTHMEETHPEKSLVCKLCGKTFRKMFHLKFHMARHDSPNSISECEICGKTFRHMSRLKRHMNAHDTEKKYTCHYCGKSFKFPEGVNQHIRNSHEYTGGPFKCDMCGRLLKTQDNLKKHMELHYQGKPFVCEVCGRRFARARNRKMHAMKSHPELFDEGSALPPTTSTPTSAVSVNY